MEIEKDTALRNYRILPEPDGPDRATTNRGSLRERERRGRQQTSCHLQFQSRITENQSAR